MMKHDMSRFGLGKRQDTKQLSGLLFPVGLVAGLD